MDTGKDIILDMKNLEKERDFIKKDCILLEKMNVLAEADKSKFQVELRKSQKECQELKRLLRRRNDKMVCDLNDKIDKMKDQILEKDHMIRGFRQRGKFTEKKIADMEKDLKDLKDQKLVSDEILEEMRLNQREANCAMEELKRDNLESSENRCQMLAAEMNMPIYEKIIENMVKEIKDLKDQKLASDEMLEEMRLKHREANRAMEELKRDSLESSENTKMLRCKMLAAEMNKTRYEEIIEEMEKELKDLKDQKLASDGIVEEMRLKQREANRAMEELKCDNLESSENTKMLRCQMLPAEMNKTRYDKIIECKEFEADQTVEGLLSRNLKACDVIEGLRKRILAFEVEKMRFEEIIEKMKRKEFKADQTVKELRSCNCNIKARDAIEGLKKDFEVEKMRLEGIIEEMKRKEFKSDETVNELRSRYLKARDAIEGVKRDFELEKTRFEEIIEEMKRKEFKADETVKELRTRNLEAHDAIEGLKECIVAFEVEKTKFEEIIEEMKRKELKADETVNDLRSRNLKACDVVEGLKKDFEVEKTRFEEIIKEMKRKEFKADETMNELRSRNLEADHAIEGLSKRIVAFEEEKRRSDKIILEMKRKQIDADQALDNLMRKNLEAVDDLKRVMVKKSMETKGARDAKVSFCKGEKHNLESGSSTSIERASNVLQQIDPIEIIDSDDEAIPGESAFNSELCPNLGEKEKISSIPSPGQSGLLADFFPRRKRSPRANEDGNSRPRKKQVPVLSHERDVSLTAHMSENPNSGFARTISSSDSKPVTVCGSPSQPLMSNSSSNENYSISDDDSSSDDDSCSDSHMEEMIRSLERERLRKT